MTERLLYHLFFMTVVSGSYDEYMTCDRLYQSRDARSLLDSVPCDMSKESFCEHKGPLYPEVAIWRFKEDNKALMKRLYGDVDSREVYREMRSNSMFNNGLHTEQEHDELREDRASSYTVNMMPYSDNMFNGLGGLGDMLRIDNSYNIRLGSGLAMVQNAKEEHRDEHKEAQPARLGEEETYRIRTRTRARTTEQTTVRTTTRTVVTVQTSTSTTSSRMSTTQQPDTTEMPMTTRQFASVQTQHTIQPTTAEVEQTTATSTEQQTISTLSEPVQESTQPLYPEPALEEGIEELEDAVLSVVEEVEDVLLPDLGPVFYPTVSEETKTEETSPDLPTTTEPVVTDPTTQPQTEMPNTEAEEVIQYTGESMNACPVYEEVKAPYWANNTRDQLLALLNLYPFEQYIHMERCKYEGDEMLCKPGCRCEQQYRLHRLLAFDPKNECRGIFSDWFRFPSFCLCKCYNVPEQIKETLRRSKKISHEEPKTPKQRHSGPGPTHNSGKLANHRMPKDANLHHQEQQEHGSSLESTKIRDLEAELARLKTLELENLRAIAMQRLQASEASIPAIFPYEGKAAIMAEMDQQMEESMKMKKKSSTGSNSNNDQDENEILKTNQDIIQDLEAIVEGHIDNTVESSQLHAMKTNKEARMLDDHFFYNNPILEFKLPDGTTGVVGNTPRKK